MTWQFFTFILAALRVAFSKKTKQGNRRDLREIHVTRQFFEASGHHGDLIEKTKKPFLDKVNGSMCAEFQVCIVVSVARRRDTNTQINTYTSEFKNILGGCSPHVDFDKKRNSVLFPMNDKLIMTKMKKSYFFNICAV